MTTIHSYVHSVGSTCMYLYPGLGVVGSNEELCILSYYISHVCSKGHQIGFILGIICVRTCKAGNS